MLILGILIGFLMATICWMLINYRRLSGKLTLYLGNPEEVKYELRINDESGEKLKTMKKVLVEVEVRNEANPN